MNKIQLFLLNFVHIHKKLLTILNAYGSEQGLVGSISFSDEFIRIQKMRDSIFLYVNNTRVYDGYSYRWCDFDQIVVSEMINGNWQKHVHHLYLSALLEEKILPAKGKYTDLHVFNNCCGCIKKK